LLRPDARCVNATRADNDAARAGEDNGVARDFGGRASNIGVGVLKVDLGDALGVDT